MTANPPAEVADSADARAALGDDPAALDARVRAACRELAAGRPVLVADDASRENEVDVILAAALATPQWLAWTIRYSSGYLCAPMPAARADALELPLMVLENEDSFRTAYTVSVDAAVGVTTGISASDRATTLRALAAPDAKPGDLIRPGHVLPLRARNGGVLERAGHTEVGVDLVRLSGAGDVAAIAELVRDDGDMMSRDDALELAREFGLAVLTVGDVIAWRQAHRNDALVPIVDDPTLPIHPAPSENQEHHA